MNEWEPIEKAPYAEYIICCIEGDMYSVMIMQKINEDLYADQEGYCGHDNPTHWMPLPEPPK